MKEDILFRNADLIKLALDDLIDQKNFFRKILLGERSFEYQIGVPAKGQKDTKEKGEEITHPPTRSSSPMWLFSHGSRSNEISFDGDDARIEARNSKMEARASSI